MIEHNQVLNLEQDFWDDFILEAVEHIEDIETNVISLEQNPDNMEIIHTMFRAFHTIKGLSGFVEHTIIQEIAHGTETLMDYCRKGELQVNSKIVDAILKSSDYIKRLCEDIESYKDNSFIDQINQLLQVLEELANIESSTSTPVTDTSIEPPKVDIELDFNFDSPAEAEAVINTTTVEPEIFEESEKKPALQGLEAFAAEIFPEIEPTEDSSEEVEVTQNLQAETEKAATSDEESQDPAIAAFLEGFKANTESQPEPKPEKIETVSETPQKKVIEEPLKDSVTEAEPLTPSGKEIITPQIIETKPESTFKPEPKAEPVAVNKTETITSEKEPPKKVIASNEEYMKVANNKIDHLVDMIGELIINQSLIDQYISSNYSNDNQLITNMSGFLRITRELQNLSMSLRMVSLKPTFQKISRIARDTIQELHKDVEFVTSGESTEIDRVVTDKLLDPLVHLIKNAISHGVETNIDDRIKYGKNKKAKVELNAYSKRGKIFIEIKDDGRGINTDIVYKKALEKGLIDPNRNYSKDEIKEFILLPGFSTAEVVDNISGRGVGMDVVKTQILKIGGKVDIQSELTKGSVFTLEIPVNHAIMNGTIIEMNGQIFIVPTINVKEILQPQDKQWIFTQQKRTMLRVREDIIPIVPISVFFQGAKLEEHVPLVMLLELDGELKALPITNVLNRQEVVVKPVGEEFTHLKYISGMSILGTGKVSLILDIDYLFKKEVK